MNAQIQIVSDNILDQFRKILGDENVLTGEVACAIYSFDSALDRATPSAVLFPETTHQISQVVKICSTHKIPFVARGAGTNLCGGVIPLHGAVVIAPTKMKKILSIDPEKKIAVVEPGLPNLFLKKVLEPYGLYYAPDPASQKACTIGGNIGTNAGGPHCLKYGVTSHHILGLEVVLPDGEIVQLSVNQPGYDLTGFFVGSEGTLGIVTKAVLNLLPIPKRVETMLVPFPTLEAAIHTVSAIISHGIIPATLEAMDQITVQAVEQFVHAGYPTNAGAVLLIEVDGDEPLTSQVEEIKKICAENGSMEFRLAANEKEREKLWEGRRGSYPSLARLAPNVLVEDGAVPRNMLPQALKAIRKIAEDAGLKVSLIFHAGDGNLHPQILFDERDLEATERVKKAGHEMLKACVLLGGTISGEHGIGIDKREAMRWLFTPETLELFRRLKNAFDPDNLSNPDKLIPISDGEKYIEPLVQEKLHPNEEVILKELLTLKANGKKGITLSTKNLTDILEHNEENFTVIVQSGMEVKKLQNFLKQKNQKVLLEESGSVGGLLASGVLQTPSLRDQVLGMRVLLSNGKVVRFGAKVMKNVAGYDACKLLLGSKGSLGVILSVILRTYPQDLPTSREKGTVPLGTVPFSPISLKALQLKVKSAFDPENIFISYV